MTIVQPRFNKNLMVGTTAIIRQSSPPPMPDPSVDAGLRGLVQAEIRVRTLEKDLHSGLYGGAAPNAIETLWHLLEKLKTADGIAWFCSATRVPGKSWCPQHGVGIHELPRPKVSHDRTR